MLEPLGVTEANARGERQGPALRYLRVAALVGRAVAALAADPDVPRWRGQSLSSGALAQVYDFTDVDGTRPDCWRCIVEVQEADPPADDAGYP